MPRYVSFVILRLRSCSNHRAVGGLIKGTGHGRSKQLAKEEAAREAYIAMGWASRA